jgi:hypothetical protein
MRTSPQMPAPRSTEFFPPIRSTFSPIVATGTVALNGATKKARSGSRPCGVKDQDLFPLHFPGLLPGLSRHEALWG